MLTFTSAISLLLCVIAIALWVRSYLRMEQFDYISSGNWYYLGWDQGRAALIRERFLVREHLNPHVVFYTYESSRLPVGYRLWSTYLDLCTKPHEKFGFIFGTKAWNAPPRPISVFVVVIPLWLFVIATSVLPLIWLRRTRHARTRARLGLCPSCGYDLRASRDRCPECGSASQSNAAT